MPDAAERCSSMEVAILPENQLCEQVRDIQKAELCPAGSLLCCLDVWGHLVLCRTADGDALSVSADGCFRDFSWEEVAAHSWGGSSFRLLAVESQGDLKLLEVEAERSSNISLLIVCKYPADLLLDVVTKQNQSVCELQSLQVLSFAAGQSYVLVNSDWLLQLQWQQAEEDLKVLSCCSVQLSSTSGGPAVDRCVCAETLFTISSTGLICILNLVMIQCFD